MHTHFIEQYRILQGPVTKTLQSPEPQPIKSLPTNLKTTVAGKMITVAVWKIKLKTQ